MQSEETPRVFDRANWRRKARVPSWVRSILTEKTTWTHPAAKAEREW